jgi:MYXO-CTERM domain-containing protein
MRKHRLTYAFSASLLFVLASAGALSAQAAPGSHRAAVSGALPLFFKQRPSADGSRRVMGGAAEAPVLIDLASAPTQADLDDLRALGVDVELRRDGSARGLGRTITGWLPAGSMAAVSALPRVMKVSLDGAPFAAPRPLDGTAAEVQAMDAWREALPGGARLTGAGVVVCDIDSGLDPFHPLFFRGDGGYVSWVDVNGDGALSPGVDGVDLDGDGAITVLRVLNSAVTAYWDDEALFDSEDPSFQVGMDWLYADADGSGEREFGPKAGFTEADPTYGERLFVADDVNRNGRVDAGEKLVALGTSKVRALRYNKKVYRRGENLIKAPENEDAAHGTGAAAVMAGGIFGLTRLVGIAPDAEIVMASNTDQTSEVTLADFCMDEGARVVLHEYAPWVGHHLDGSSAMEALIDASVAKGVVHINPAGNLSTSQKLYKRALAAGEEMSIAIEAPVDSPYAPFSFMGISVLWRDPSRSLSMVLEDPTGYSMAVTSADPAEVIDDSWQGGLSVYAMREDSSRGTSRVDVYLYGEGLSPASIELGGWTLRVKDPSPQGGAPVEVIAYLFDDASGWGKGIHFPEFSSEDHLVGYPGTADFGVAVSAYTGHGFFGGESGERAEYSGRGHRIDGASILWIAAPDDPITAGYREGSPAVDFVYGGTSGASPHVAGAAALLIQQDPARTGKDVREAIKAGALVDEAVGAVPNDDFGHGKLRIYKSLFGEDPPGGSAPVVTVGRVSVGAGEAAEVAIKVFDADEAAGGVGLEIDRDYDGVFEESLMDPVIRGTFEAVGTYVSKVRATDGTGRQSEALAVIDVVEVKKVDEGAAPALVAGGGCAHRSEGAGTGAVGAVLGIAGLAMRRWRRRR